MVTGFTTMPGFEFLHLPHLRGLHRGFQIAVNDADAAGLRHGDRHMRFGHGVHGRRHDRDIEPMLRVIRERISTSDGSTSDKPGLISTSSKVRPSRGLFLSIANSAYARVAARAFVHAGASKAEVKWMNSQVERSLHPPSSTSKARFWVGAGS